MEPIQASELVHEMQTLPLNSPMQGILISRAYRSKQPDLAYQYYSDILARKPDDGYANLLKGMAAEYCWFYHFMDNKEVSQQTNNYFDTAKMCLYKAVTILPQSALTNAQYGVFDSEYLGDTKDGLKYGLRAVEIDPHSWITHDYLGWIYTNMTRKEYDPHRAEQEYLRALSINNNIAVVHFDLVALYCQLKRYGEADKEMH